MTLEARLRECQLLAEEARRRANYRRLDAELGELRHVDHELWERIATQLLLAANDLSDQLEPEEDFDLEGQRMSELLTDLELPPNTLLS